MLKSAAMGMCSDITRVGRLGKQPQMPACRGAQNETTFRAATRSGWWHKQQLEVDATPISQLPRAPGLHCYTSEHMLIVSLPLLTVLAGTSRLMCNNHIFICCTDIPCLKELCWSICHSSERSKLCCNVHATWQSEKRGGNLASPQL